jgi:hypothetical protein
MPDSMAILDERSIDFVIDCVEKRRVTLEFGEPEWWAQAPHHVSHHVGDDVVCVVEFYAGEKVGVAGDVGDHETSGFSFRKHSALLPAPVGPRSRPEACAGSASLGKNTPREQDSTQWAYRRLLTRKPLSAADSTGQRNSVMKSLSWSLVLQRLPWPLNDALVREAHALDVVRRGFLVYVDVVHGRVLQRE